MKFIQLKVLSFVRKNTEVFLLMLLLVVSTLIIQVYNSQNTNKEYPKKYRELFDVNILKNFIFSKKSVDFTDFFNHF